MINHRMFFLVYFPIPLLKIGSPPCFYRYHRFKRKKLPVKSPIMGNTATWLFRMEKIGTRDFGR